MLGDHLEIDENGGEQEPMSEVPEELAWHEAGHAVAAILLGFHVHSVEIKDEGSSDFLHAVIGIAGETHSTASTLAASAPSAVRWHSAVVAMAGRAAREFRWPDVDEHWANLEADDRKRALALFQRDEAPEARLAEAYSHAQRLAAENVEAIHAVAELIIRAGVPGTVAGGDIERAVRAAVE